MKYLLLFVLCILSVRVAFCSLHESLNTAKFMLSGNWALQSSILVPEGGEIISTEQFRPTGWYPTSVPTTVLNALVKNGVYPDPRIGMNNYKIPDVSDQFNQKYNLARYSHLGNGVNPWQEPYWFRTEFRLPDDYKGKKLQLHFDGINYRAEVWLNGHKIAERKWMMGMFLRFAYDITPYAAVNNTNCLAVKIFQVDHPGTPDPGVQFTVFGKNRGGAEDIFKDETLRCSGGTDCSPVMRDRNMGIYQDVYITASGQVAIENPFVTTDLPLPDTTRADIKISVDLTNYGNKEVRGVLNAKISLINKLEFPTYSKFLGGSMPDILISKQVTLPVGRTTKIELNSNEFPELAIDNPHLWWPNGYGKQYLHNLELSFSTAGNISDEEHVAFGIRMVINELKKIGDDYGRVFYINGKRIFCKGGWLQPPAMLEQDTKRVYDEARLLAKANVNMVAYEDAPSPRDVVLEAYDKYGIMVWEVFYGCWRMYPGTTSANNPLDHDLALREARDIIRRYRNHPSLVLWCVANETTVAEDIYTPLRKYVFDLDGTRPFIPTSNISWDVDKLTPYIKADLPLGTTDYGEPDYNWNPETYYFEKVLEVTKQTFRNELGVPSVPVYSSLKKFIPQFSNETDSPVFPLDSVWSEHGAIDGKTNIFSSYDNALRSRYGIPVSVGDYAKKAQFVNADSYRAMYEAANHRMWDITSGVMLWKLNACWPTVLWQLYDWFLCQNAAYYFAQNAMEPVHVQMNANSRTVSIINTRHNTLGNISLRVRVIDDNMQVVWSRNDTTTIGKNRYQELYTIPEKLPLSTVYFVALQLNSSDGDLLSENLYWLSSKTPPDFSWLADIKPAALDIVAAAEDTGKEYRITVKLKNPTSGLSLFNRLLITRGEEGGEALPTFWDKNFITLFPGETKTVRAAVAKGDLHGDIPFISIDGNNEVAPQRLKIGGRD